MIHSGNSLTLSEGLHTHTHTHTHTVHACMCTHTHTHTHTLTHTHLLRRTAAFRHTLSSIIETLWYITSYITLSVIEL